jgi:hypothetical protein
MGERLAFTRIAIIAGGCDGDGINPLWSALNQGTERRVRPTTPAM